VIIILCLLSIDGIAQSGGFNSPFSRFGIGDLVDPNPIHLRLMGGGNAAYADNFHINHVNPASLVFLRATSFDIGVNAKFSQLSDEGQEKNLWSGNLEYLSIAFPLRNPLNEVYEVDEKRDWRIGMGFNLRPLSRVSYFISNIDSDDEIGSFRRDFRGSGGSYQAQWGTGFQYKKLSFGINLGYMFGKLSYQRNIEFENPFAFDSRFLDDYDLRGFTYNVGAIYQLFINEEAFEKDPSIDVHVVNFGLYTNSSTSIRTNSTTFYQSIYEASQTGAIIDTLQYNVLTNWSSYKNDANPETLFDTKKLSFGGFYRPNYKSFNYLNKMFYRFGIYTSEEPQVVNQTQLKNFGVNVGVGLPFLFQRKISHINVGAEFGRRNVQDVLRENFVKLSIGLTFNDDEWFYKRKYE